MVKHVAGNAIINKSPVTKSESMVRTKYHAQQSKTRRGSINNAQPLKGREGEEGRGEATSGDRQGPEGGAHDIVFEFILFTLTTKNAR